MLNNIENVEGEHFVVQKRSEAPRQREPTQGDRGRTGTYAVHYSSVLWSRSQTFLLEPEPDKKAPALVPGCCRVT